MRQEREIWLDVLRGITISLVVLNHCILSVGEILKNVDSDLHPLVYHFNDFLGMVRMPAFFLCSGILFAGPAKRGWAWFVEKRLTWVIWVSMVWGWLSIIVISGGFPLYPWGDSPISPLEVSLLSPIGNMWFIYAIIILGAFCMLIRDANRYVILLLAVAISVFTIKTLPHLDPPEGIERVLRNLGRRGVLFFAIGFAFSHVLKKPQKGSIFSFTGAMLVWMVSYYMLKRGLGLGNFDKMLLCIPATFCAIHMLQYLFAKLPEVWRPAGHVGSRSLEIFLVHQFVVGLAFLVFSQFFASSTSDIILLASYYLAVMLGSYFVGGVLSSIHKNPFFSSPVQWKLQAAGDAKKQS